MTDAPRPAPAASAPARTSGWTEAADRVFLRRYQPFDVNVTVVLGADAALVADTRGSLAEARELREHIRQLTALPVHWVVNTHVHFDHVWGNAEFTAPRQTPPAALWAHRATVDAMLRADDDPEAAAFRAEMTARGTEPGEAVPEHAVEGRQPVVLDLGGGREVVLRHLGRGHTDGDLLLHVPDAGAFLTGDLVEESGSPAVGPDAYPQEWPETLDALLAWAGDTADAVFLPGHGHPVDAAFVAAQRDALRALAHALRAGGEGLPLSAEASPFTWKREAVAHLLHT